MREVSSYNPKTEKISVSNPFEITGRSFLYVVVKITNLLTGKQRNLKKSTRVRISDPDSIPRSQESRLQILSQYQETPDQTLPISLGKFYKLYYHERELDGLSKSSLIGIASAFKALLQKIGDGVLLTRINSSMIKEFLSSETSASVAVAHYRYLKAAFAYAVQDGILEKNPFDRINKKVYSKRFKPRPRGMLSPEQIILIYNDLAKNTFADRTFGNFFLVLFGAALRRSEASYLLVADVDLRLQTICIRADDTHSLKTSASEATLPMTTFSKYAIEQQLQNLYEHPEAAVRNSPYLFPNRQGRAYNPDSLTKAVIKRIKACCKKLGIDAAGLDLHSARHSMLQKLIDLGGEPSIVSRFGRHASLLTTLQNYHRSSDVSTKFESVLQATSRMPAIEPKPLPSKAEKISGNYWTATMQKYRRGFRTGEYIGLTGSQEIVVIKVQF
jgi:integrase